MAQVFTLFQTISLTSIDGTIIDPSADDAVIVYSSTGPDPTGDMNWTYEIDSYEDSVSWIAQLGDTSIRTFNYNDFPDNQYIKLEIVPGGCYQDNCSATAGYDFYGDEDITQPYNWLAKGWMVKIVLVIVT